MRVVKSSTLPIYQVFSRGNLSGNADKPREAAYFRHPQESRHDLSRQISGVRRTEVLLEQATRAPHLDERGATRARINMDFGLLRKLQKKPDLARQFLEKARAPAKLHGATLFVTKIDAALAEMH